MRTLRVGIIDLITNAPARTFIARHMHANYASIAPQAVGVWCEQQGHRVSYVTYTGVEDLLAELPADVELVFIGAFTEAAFTAYALSQLFRARGAVTVLGGPHARCYPRDSCRYFDYVVGFTDANLVRDIVEDCRPNRPEGIHLSAARQPSSIPGVRQRWKFIEATLRKARFLKMVGVLGSTGCPYTCSFCIDSRVPYQPCDLEELKGDLAFLRTRFKRPMVGWFDPNFGVRFDALMAAIEEAVPPDTVDFAAEGSLSILSESHVKRLKRNGFKALLPGIDSWFDCGDKCRTGTATGIEKVRQVSDLVRMITRHIPYVQANFVLGRDTDEGPEPFELTNRFMDLNPAVFPGYSLLSAFGQAAPDNVEFQRAGRVLPIPYHFLDTKYMNVRPKHYSWPDFYGHMIDLEQHAFSARAILRRLAANRGVIPRWMNFMRAMSSEGLGRIAFYTNMRRMLETDAHVRRFYEQETTQMPTLFEARIREDLGPLMAWLPAGAIEHAAYA